MLVLRLKEQPSVPLEAEVLSPDVLSGLDRDRVRALPIYLGKRQLRLEDFFEIDGDASDEIEVHGDLSKVKWIGRGMTKGHIRVIGNMGMHLGAYMKGGSIEVSGNASDWVGGEMTGGTIHIRGNAGGQTGSAYRGSTSGMSGGSILIEGSAGIELGMRMKRGLIAVRGPVRDFAGLQMKGGSIFLMSGAELRTGAWMMRGTIVSMQPLRLLPTFAPACTYNPTILNVYANHLRKCGFTLPHNVSEGCYQRYIGDAAIPGKGEILVWQSKS